MVEPPIFLLLSLLPVDRELVFDCWLLLLFCELFVIAAPAAVIELVTFVDNGDCNVCCCCCVAAAVLLFTFMSEFLML